jgi:hypothetical protein
MKRFALLLLLFLVTAHHAFAVEPANNKFGMSLLQPTQNDIEKTANLVNSQGGDWGYVTLVIQEDDRDRGKWQGLFDELRRHHLIPIVRIATKPEGENWRRPKPEEAGGWAQFLDSLNWVVKERYVVLFNEPNHAWEWGGEVNPEDYGKVALAFAKKFKEKNRDFFVMLAGMDASAPSYGIAHEDEGIFLDRASSAAPGLFASVDGIASHSYPNPAFSGSPWDTGKKSIRGYEWELEKFRSLGARENLPVFITETGWVDDRLSRDTIASYYKTAFDAVWGPDQRVVAVTPFVFSYQSAPFLGFSWKTPGGNDEFYPQYHTVLELPKPKGAPLVVERGRVTQDMPHEFVASSNYRFTFRLENTGQAIWDKDEGYELGFAGDAPVPFQYFFSDIKGLEPFRETDVSLYIKTHNVEGEHAVSIALRKNGETIAKTTDWKFVVLPLPDLDIEASLYPKLSSNGSDFEVQIYNEREELVYRKSGVRLQGGKGTVGEVQNIVFGKKYRVVLLKPYYLPRQSFVTFRQDANRVVFKRLLPFDFNRDGAMTLDDAGALFNNAGLLRLFVP